MGRCLIAIVIAGLLVAPPTVAATKPGRTVAQAQTSLEVSYIYVEASIVTAARTKLAETRRLGSPTAIAEMEEVLAKAKAGMNVTRAQCVGVRPAVGGFVSFRCKLRLRDGIGFTATMRGSYARNAVTGRWKWSSTSYVRDVV